jgi:hypothetical protein
MKAPANKMQQHTKQYGDNAAICYRYTEATAQII